MIKILLRIFLSWSVFIASLTVVLGIAIRRWGSPIEIPDEIAGFVQNAQSISRLATSILSELTDAPIELFDWSLLVASLLVIVVLTKFAIDFVKGDF